jgi:16S rRNA (guanine966-N2)-methyltransferase
MNHGTVRIIGGKWRGRKLHFPAMPDLRPTPDRVRETLFNWLAPMIAGARCLDLFAGSGALGFEALSRGAGAVMFIDRDPAIAAYLQQQLALFFNAKAGANTARVQCATFPFTLPAPTEKFNLVFLDPPFQQNLLPASCAWLIKQNCLAGNAYIYLETAADVQPLPIPAAWELVRSKTAGQVGYHLAQVKSGG